ncbi:MAG TPA: hypothetical protein PLZ93_12165 [Nocardioides sp.]|uniref:hypothetical protein n=1 Tax=uncultured Nocardioides sp. TaxID=198441 RepID=UPI000EC6335B|nr:hypothetical protein [uncultured Nocardioides sp.]HCB04885.1 hypothetical protein [Nocardioides sp.]HRD61972.1 hypothetical protein [Nocardioides sp.]HRI96365.1 hypothetical protein [Nocardioides sp.]HRK45727.1 hypothetical protein [Nocardioides sp.]
MDASEDAFSEPVHLRRDLVGLGWNDRGIADQLKRGIWVRPRRGAYLDAGTWKTLDAAGRHVIRTRAVVKQANTGVAVSHASAVPWWGGPIWDLDLGHVHTTRLDGRLGRKEAGVHQHCGSLQEGDLAVVHGHQVTTPARVALEVSTIASMEASLVVLNDFLHRKLTTPQAVRERYERSIDLWPNTRATELVVRLGDPRISSVLETRFCFFCFRARLPMPVPQYEVRTPDGHLVAVLDFAWPDLGAYVETNGRAKYLQLLKPDQEPGEVVERERRRDELVQGLTRMRGMHVSWTDLNAPRLLDKRVRDHLWPADEAAS